MPVVTLTSDYGMVDPRVATIKGGLLSLDENVKIVDITHEIAPYDLQQAAYIIRSAYSHFPGGSVHLLCVDNMYREEVKSLVYKVNGHYFLCADNGLMSLIFFDIQPEYIFAIPLQNKQEGSVLLYPVLDTYVPAALHLLEGGLPEQIGKEFSAPVEIKLPTPAYHESEKMISGEVIYIDHFGNLVTNISRELFQDKILSLHGFTIKFRNISLSKIYSRYTDFIAHWADERSAHGRVIAIFNESQLLEICIYKGNIHNGAHSLFGLDVGAKVYVEFYEQGH
ncbi:MAG: SAM-dependent chlorinase/fluorinase [Bergeyella sp.]|nr:SAM-dependent chlorinase/fluorinase [Bergeyella sp.]